MEWNEEHVTTLTRLWRDGYSASQVARQLGGVSRSAVIGKVHRLGLTGRSAPSRPHAPGGRLPTRAKASARASAGGVGRTTHAARAETPAAPQGPFDVAPTASLLTLTRHACRWPIGEPDAADFGFCGRAKAAGAYCAGHAAMSRKSHAPMKTRDIERLVGRYAEGPVL